MKKLNVFLLALLLMGIPFLLTATGQARAQFGLSLGPLADQNFLGDRFGQRAQNAGQENQAQNAGQRAQNAGQENFLEERFEDNPARFGEALAQGKKIVPDISAIGAQNAGEKAQNAGQEIRFQNVLPKAQLQDENNQFNENRANKQKANRQQAAKAQKNQNAFEFNQMVGNEKFSADVNGVQAAETPMRVKGGKAALDRNMNFKMGVRGLQQADGEAAAGRQFKAGVACLDSGTFMAKGENQEEGNFTVNENGDADFQGKMDFAGASCIAPTPMMMDEKNRFVAVGGNGMMNEEAMMDADKEQHADQNFDKAVKNEEEKDVDNEKAAKEDEKNLKKKAKEFEKVAKEDEKELKKKAKELEKVAKENDEKKLDENANNDINADKAHFADNEAHQAKADAHAFAEEQDKEQAHFFKADEKEHENVKKVAFEEDKDEEHEDEDDEDEHEEHEDDEDEDEDDEDEDED